MLEGRKTEQGTAREDLAEVGVERKQAVNAGSAKMPKTAQKIDKSPPSAKQSPKSRKRTPWGTKTKAIIEIKEKHPDLNTREVGELVGCDHSHVVKVLARWGIKQSENEEYKKNRADILAGVGKRILETLTDEDIKKASLNQKVVSYGILYDKERLERDKSTVIVGYDHQAMADRLAELRQMLADVTEAEVVE